MATQKTYTNQQIAQLLKDIATAYIIKKKNPFRITAYQDAAANIINYPRPLQQIWKKDKKLLDNIPGIGEAILNKLDYLFTHHRLHPHVIRAFANIHPSVFIFTRIDGIGPKNAYKLSQKLKFPPKPIPALKKLIDYAHQGKIQKLPTFGKKSEHLILKNSQNYLDKNHRLSLSQAQKIARQIINYLQNHFPQIEFYPLGSLRRLSPTVGDIDIAAKSNQNSRIIKHFLNFPDKKQIISQGSKKASIKTKGNVQIDLMVQPSSSFGSLLQHFTGSRQHNILLRRHAQKMGLSLSEYGITDTKTKKLHTFKNEKSFYTFLKLAYIKPQNRAGGNEIKIAQKCYTKSIKINK